MSTKVKDATMVWLQNQKWGRTGCTHHFFINKRISICGRAQHPRKQFNAAYVKGEHCQHCLKLRGLHGYNQNYN